MGEVKMRASLLHASMLLLLTSCFSTESFRITQYQAENPKKKNDALASFLFSDMHGLTVNTLKTNAIPVKIALTTILLQRQEKDKSVNLDKKSIKEAFVSWGFFYSDSLPVGWDQSEKLPTHDFLPIGMDSGELLGPEGRERIEIMNFNCSSCHTGTGYEASGRPNLKYIPGLPNTSLNLDKFIKEVFQGLLRYSNDKDFAKKTLDTVVKIFPETSHRELSTMKVMVPVLKNLLNKLNEQFGAFLPTNFGGAGQSNAVGLFKSRYKVKKYTERDPKEAGYVSIPALYNKGFRSSLLVDGSTAPTGEEFYREMTLNDITPEHIKKLTDSSVYFPVLVTGASEKGSIAELPRLEKIIDYFTHRTPERFPGKIDEAKALKGRTFFENRCSGCHGKYEGELLNQKLVSYPNRLVDLDKIGTDPVRANGITEPLVKRIAKSEIAQYIEIRVSHGYVAPMLNSVWATAPYFHNGSVPTLWDLMHASSRPKTFKVGGHMLDFKKVGISYPEDYTPWTQPFVYNTEDYGRSNTGHLFPFNKMSEEEKEDVTEYLKLL